MRAADADAFRRAFYQLQSDLGTVSSTLAKERLENLLRPQRTSQSRLSYRLASSLKEVVKFSQQMKGQLSMPRSVDLNHVILPSGMFGQTGVLLQKYPSGLYLLITRDGNCCLPLLVYQALSCSD